MTNGIFVKDLDLIDAFANYSDRNLKKNLAFLRKLRHGSSGHYFGEYISQGCLDINGICSQATIQDLIDGGLFQIMPKLENKDSWDGWANRVIELRAPFSALKNASLSIHSDVRRAIAIAETWFSGRWALPVAVMLLALKPRMDKDHVILDAFAAVYSAKL
jgi:hypothetical protein